MKQKLLFGVLCTLLSFQVLKAQDLNVPAELKEEASEKYVLFSDDVRSKNYTGALPNLSWMLEKTPKIHKSLYQKGIRTYKELADAEKDAKRKRVYQDSVMLLHDLRIKHFGEEDKVMNDKAYISYYYYYEDTDMYDDMYEMYKKAFELNGENIYPQNVEFFFTVMSFMKGEAYFEKYQDELSDDNLTVLYEKMSKIIEKNIAKNGEDVDEWKRIQQPVAQYYGAMVPITCSYIKKYIEPEYRDEAIFKDGDVLAIWPPVAGG